MTGTTWANFSQRQQAGARARRRAKVEPVVSEKPWEGRYRTKYNS